MDSSHKMIFCMITGADELMNVEHRTSCMKIEEQDDLRFLADP